MAYRILIKTALSAVFFGISMGCLSMEEIVWKEGTPEWGKSEYLAACWIVKPIIRITPEEYAVHHQTRKLVLGGGHIQDPYTVEPKDYQPDQGSGLRESYQGNYQYHKNEGWYAVSAEVTSSFNSDMACNIRDPQHQACLTREKFWDIIWDDSGHVSVFEAPGLLEKIPQWLKPGGKYIVGIPSLGGRSEEERRDSIAQQIVKLYEKGGYDLSPELGVYVDTELKKLGFSQVEVKLSPFMMACKQEAGEKSLNDYMEVLDEEIEANKEEIKRIMQKAAMAYTEEVALVDPVFREATLGCVYIVATR